MAKQSRLRLHDMFTNTLGIEHVYFQPPESMKLQYPCIVYSRANADTEYASNLPYKFNFAYQVTYISYDPDDSMVDNILSKRSASSQFLMIGSSLTSSSS